MRSKVMRTENHRDSIRSAPRRRRRMTPASTSQSRVAAAVETKLRANQHTDTSSEKQGTVSHRCIILTFARIMALVLLLTAGMPIASSSVFRSVHATRYWHFCSRNFCARIPTNICHAGRQRLSSKLSRCHPYVRVRKKLSIR